ncbi:MAG: MBL fold metallo-hydrolase [Thermodesulfobacteriota bacterium]|nr:MBL fold metallo-hydrolase [Thermodesulfobacteriota bacterium]
MKENKIATVESERTSLEPIDRVEITILVDNFIDHILKSSPGVSRPRDRDIDESLLAEHGLSLLLDITREGETSSFLLDTGPSQYGVIHNAQKMGINLKRLKGIFLSHNHKDHTDGLEAVLAITGPVPVFIHPYGFYTKWVKARPSRLDRERLAERGAIWRAEEGPQSMASFLLTSGSVPRKTEFEEIIGLSDRKVEKDGVMETEAFLDDGALILTIKGKGLVIVTGCAHSGIINTIQHCQKLGGNERIYALIGGFHLTQASSQRITKTIETLRKKEIRYLVPLHCTGFEAMASIWQAFPEHFIVPSVGTRVEL